MQLPEHVPDHDDATGLALTLIRAFGSGTLPMVDEQVMVCADDTELHRRWSRIRTAVATLTGANAHMEAALDLLDEVGESSIPPALVQAISLLGLRDGGRQPTGNATVNTCGSAYFGGLAQHHLDIAQRSTDAASTARHLNEASYYASIREHFDRST